MKAAHVEALLSRPRSGLEDLALSLPELDAPTVAALGAADAPALRRLTLWLASPRRALLAELARSPSIGRLTHLALWAHAIDAQALGALARSPFAREGAQLYLRAASLASPERDLKELSARGVTCHAR